MTKDPINIYCDESTHLPADGMPYMVLGAVACFDSKTREASQRIADIKVKHGLHRDFEIKWSKVSMSKVDFYEDVIDYFFDDDDLGFRGVIAPKGGLDHSQFSQTHDEWYYKMMFLLLRELILPEHRMRVYLDKKDTRGGQKVRKLHEVMANSQYDFDKRWIERFQIIESHHVAQIQVADLLAGAINYANRGLDTSQAKQQLIRRVKERSTYDLTRSTLPSEKKFNVFHWRPRQQL